MRLWLLVLLLGTVALACEVLEKEEDTAPVEEGDEDEEVLHVGRVIRQIIFPDGQRPGFGGGGTPGGRPVLAGPCNCVPIVTCATELKQVQFACTLPGGAAGVCCPPSALAAHVPARGTGDSRVFVAPRSSVNLDNVDSNVVNEACQKGVNAVQSFNTLDEQLIEQGIFLSPGTPAHGHFRQFSVRPDIVQRDKNALTIVMASRNIFTDLSLTRQGGPGALSNMLVSDTILGNLCPRPPTCTNINSKYRTADGSCNNPNNHAWGKSGTPAQRILPPKYEDGIIAPRSRSVVDGSPLPNVRRISSNIMVDVDNPDQDFTSGIMHWSQFLDHDTTHLPFPSLSNGEGIQCCPNGTRAPDNQLHPRCLPIDVTGDPFYASRGRTCMNFVRTMLGVGPGAACTFGPAEQLNQLTHWIDGSMIYGSNLTDQFSLRLRRDGLFNSSGNSHLPLNPNQGGFCAASERGALCYSAGDSRNNQQPGLTATHIVWHREHNRVARALKTLNPTWSDEALFQEARRIVVAELQHITYNEFLPIIVGPTFMRAYGINTRAIGYSNDYNPNINPNMNNEFSTAAYRFGHTLIQGRQLLFSASDQVSTVFLRDHFNSPHLIQQVPGGLDMLLRSFGKQASQSFDSYVSQDVTNHLFQTPRVNFGLDLMSINIHRGRDHALATYNEIRQVCGLPRARNFNDIKDQIPSQIADNLARLYKSVDDIDFFVGGLVERPVAGGLLGWTFLCVVGDQFARLKKGDRYFYDLGGQPGSFTEPQLQEIRRTSWARILCDNGDNLERMQPLVFVQTNNRFNQPVSCNSPIIPRPNLLFWRGERPAA